LHILSLQSKEGRDAIAECEKEINLQQFYPDSLRIKRIEYTDGQIILRVKSQKHSHCCPACGVEMDYYHGTYVRTVQDLPILGKKVMLKITAYEYRCSNDSCKVTSFVEDYEGFVGRSDRMTSRLEDFVITLALETSCEGAAAICSEMGIRTSGDTIIRLLKKLVEVPAPTPGEVVGVDDFAYRKGHTYCTVVCDGGTHQPIAIFDGRDGNSLREWLQSNKQIKKVTRDRAGAYASAITEALPEALQIADRFHLHQNLLNAIKEALKQGIPNNILVPNTLPEFPEPDSVKKNRL
jgi:transposase